VLHGVPVTDPYRWLEDSESPETRRWLEEQRQYARAYLDQIEGRDSIRKRIRELLDVESVDGFVITGNRYVFRKRLPNQEQPSIYLRESAQGQDQLLVDPARRANGKYAAVKPVRLSPDGRLLLYEVKHGGERTARFELLDIENRRTLTDVLPRGYLRGFGFARDSRSFYYVHEALESPRPFYRAVRHHVLGTPLAEDREVFCAGEDQTIRLHLVADTACLGFLVYQFRDKTRIDFYLQPLDRELSVIPMISGAEYSFAPRFISRRLFALTDHEAPNFRIVELCPAGDHQFEWIERVPEQESQIRQWIAAGNRIVVSYVRGSETRVSIYDLDGQKAAEWPIRHSGRTVRLIAGAPDRDEMMIETESFLHPPATLRCSLGSNDFTLWAKRNIPFDPKLYAHAEVRYASKDGTQVPMSLVGLRDVLKGGSHPAIMTAYGGYGVPMTPQFSVFVAFLMERGCLFALPNIRGGSEFGVRWHNAAKRRKRQVAYDDFLAAAEWLITTGRTTSGQLAIFGGSNSGLLVGVALTERPDLFRAVVCLAPLLDMLRYHLFDGADIWRDEFGTADDPGDFAVLLEYSPYHRAREGVEYPATMVVSGDLDGNCNPLHARKMTARLQQANVSKQPIFLDYGSYRGHSPVLPLSDRIEALTDRMAFLSDQLALSGAPKET
jgi:prolyl oligopeptidase